MYKVYVESVPIIPPPPCLLRMASCCLPDFKLRRARVISGEVVARSIFLFDDTCLKINP